MYDLNRFITAQATTYSDAYFELKNEKKTSHWMWFIFPQIAGLGHSSTSKFYELADVKEARLFLMDPLLGKRLIEITSILVDADHNKTAKEIFGHPDDLKFHSCMTLFDLISDDKESVFHEAIERYFDGILDDGTLHLIG